MTAYYNEIDPYAAQWLRNLINAGHIAPGIVDERSIEDVYPSDLRGFTQCHFFAGIGVWSYALRSAGWSDDRPVWTGSCPCQPFSAAGQGAGFADERHLWPAFKHLIKECRPAIVFGEQVASKDADPWIDLVCNDLEALGYAFGAVPFPSAGVGAPHIRDRLYWVADTAGDRRVGKRAGATVQAGRELGPAEPWVLALGLKGRAVSDVCAGAGMGSGGMADTQMCGYEQRQQFGRIEREAYGKPQSDISGSDKSFDDSRPAGPTNGRWSDADWLFCRDGKWRPVEPGTFPLVDGTPARVGRLRAYGNAINAKAAQAFIECVMDTTTPLELT